MLDKYLYADRDKYNAAHYGRAALEQLAQTIAQPYARDGDKTGGAANQRDCRNDVYRQKSKRYANRQRVYRRGDCH